MRARATPARPLATDGDASASAQRLPTRAHPSRAHHLRQSPYRPWASSRQSRCRASHKTRCASGGHEAAAAAAAADTEPTAFAATRGMIGDTIMVFIKLILVTINVLLLILAP